MFDVDKLYLATKQYDENGKEIQFENIDDTKGYTQEQLTSIYRKQSMAAIQNRLIDNYQTIISDQLNFADSRASIDVLTSTLKKNILPLVRESTTGYLQPGIELTPAFQSLRKMEYSTGKSGIGPFALNITNLALTQFVHLSMDYGDNIFNFGDLDQIYGQDGERISGWLSAMVNAHVDVAKDPYVLSLNVNQLTYKYVNFLLRAGKGISTFTFIAQPALKKFTERAIASGGMYGRNVDGKTPDNTILKKSANSVYYEILNEYTNKLKAQLSDYKKAFSQEKDNDKKAAQQNFILEVDKLLNGKEGNTPYKLVFNLDNAASALTNKDSIYSTYFQVLCLKSLKKIEPYADELSSLVTVSRVDTKKFGNNIAAQLHYINNLNAFRYGEHKHSNKAIQWIILDKNGKNVAAELPGEKGNIDGSRNALDIYFNNTFLDSKLRIATGLTRQLLRRQTITATDVFRNAFLTFMARKGGKSEIFTGDNNTMANYVYNMMVNEKTVNTIASAIECVMRYRAMSNIGVYENSLFANNIIQTLNSSSPLKYNSDSARINLGKKLFGIKYNQVDLTCNHDKRAVTDRLRSIMYGYTIKNDNGETINMPSLFTRVSNLLYALKAYPEQFSDTGLIDADGNVINELLNYLNPQPANENFPYGRLLLKTPNVKLGIDTKQILVSAFDQLLSNPNEQIKALANDIAFYAYYSSYDTIGANSFFDLIPTKYRKQYDQSLRMALNAPDSLLESIIGDIDDVCDVISRNYWYDSKIVDSYIDHQQSKKFGTFAGQHNLKTLRLNKQSVPGVIITSYANSDFFTLKLGDNSYLYKLVGVIYATNDSETKKLRNVYTVIPKAGIHSGRNHVYEFNVSLSEASLYKENMLPSYFKYTQDTIDYIQNLISDTKQLTKYQKEHGMHLEYESVSPLQISSEDYYDVAVKEHDDTITTFGNVKISLINDKQTLLNKSDVQIDLTQLKSKQSIDEIVSQIIKDIDIESSVNNPISISIKGELSSDFVSSQFKNDVINEQLSIFENRLRDSEEEYSDTQIQHMLNEFKNRLESDSKFIYSIRVQQFASDIMQSLYGKGLQIGNILLDGDTQSGVNIAINLNNNPDVQNTTVLIDSLHDKSDSNSKAVQLSQNINFGISASSIMDEVENNNAESLETKEQIQQQTDLLVQGLSQMEQKLQQKEDKNMKRVQELTDDVDTFVSPNRTTIENYDYLDLSDAVSGASFLQQTNQTNNQQVSDTKKTTITNAEGNPIDTESTISSSDLLSALSKPVDNNDKNAAESIGDKLNQECNK